MSRFAFLNANHSKSANILLNHDIIDNSYDVVLLNEPYYTNFGIPFFKKNYNIISYQVNPRVASIITNRNYKYTTIVVERDIIVLNININDENYILICIYLHLKN